VTLRVGVVGAGSMAEAHVPAWQALAAEVVVHSLRPPTRFAARHRISVSPSLADLADRCEVVDVCSPTTTHEEVVRTALDAGCQVVCEKPLARTAAAAQSLVDRAAEAGLMLFPAHVVRYFPAYRDAEQRVRAGEVGAVRSLHLTRQVASPREGWFHDVEASGGVVLDLMVHDLDQALWLLGPVRGVAAERLDSDGDWVRAQLEHVGGATSTVEARWGPPEVGFATEVTIQGRTGTLHHSATDVPSGADDPYLLELRDVAEHLGSGSPTRVGAQDGVAAVALAERVLSAVNG
jgi:myo-inositol 2-dehydrogenase/D-chiro-inositol 1-dehydrogenase